VAAATALGRVFGANATTVGFVYLVVVLFTAARLGFAASATASLAATACYNYFFLPPVGTWTIAAPANWVALTAFLIASVLVSRLVASEQRRAEEAEARRSEMEALYELSVDLFAATNRVGALGDAAGRALRSIDACGGALVLYPGVSGHGDVVVATGDHRFDPSDPLLESVGRSAEAAEVPAADGARDAYLPLALGGRSSGVLLVRGTRADRHALASVGRLVALAVEREKFLEERTHLEALRESDAIKTSLLRAVSHDLRTPITAIQLGLERLRRTSAPAAAADVHEVSTETERLSRRIDNLLAMARLDAGTYVPRPEPAPPADLFRATLEALPLVLSGRAIDVTVALDTPDALADPALAVEILANLLENAARSTPAPAALKLDASRHPTDAGRVRLDVLDRGAGVPADVKRAASSGVSPAEAGRAGLGLVICASLARAMGGSIALLDRPGGGTIARLDLPAAEEASA
jgi:two-component system sensor histidine kinase KdpD